MKKLNITFHNPNSKEVTAKKLTEILSKEIVHNFIETNTIIGKNISDLKD